jgi:hypothetical protein
MPITTKVTTINLGITNASQTYTFTAIYKTLIISATQNCWININEASSSNTTGFYIDKTTVYTIPLNGAATISYIRSSDDGRLTILALS